MTARLNLWFLAIVVFICLHDGIVVIRYLLETQSLIQDTLGCHMTETAIFLNEKGVDPDSDLYRSLLKISEDHQKKFNIIQTTLEQRVIYPYFK